tara:strand:- start:2372 stop:2935 length:564 start_codon:yes stop_codon:yes gene_type:complete
MNNTKIILYDCLDIYKILEEINDIFKLSLISIENKKELESYIKNLDTYLVITKLKKFDNKNKLQLNDLPIKLEKLIEKINLGILKNNFKEKSKVNIKNYLLDTNSREIFYKGKSIKLTEQEVKILLYLMKYKTPISIGRLQKDIWDYGEGLETHTVETHIHRLRKKFTDIFDDSKLILSTKNGYLIN